ncbi:MULTISPECIES: sodium:solute symporter family protein [unclassified Brevibacterium]|uniref:sodium:solute symporter family protein n=1 Tax=unclassified Brevibacterium TaxID=2614124 RepID=UPI00143DA4BD|nr:sodium:solute symporter family protein [Brevibacterium sp. S22]
MFAAAIFGSFLLYLVIGAVVGRRVKDKSDYYVAGRAAPTFLVAGTLVASFLSTVSFMGELGFSYDGYPVVMLLLTAFNISGYVLGVMLFGRYLRRSSALTVPEYFGKRFNSPGLQALAGVMVVVGIGLYLVAVTQGLVLVIGQLIDIPQWVLLVIVWASYTIFTFLSGSQGVLVNDTIMFVVFTVAAILGMGWIIGASGGPVTAMQKMAALTSKPDGISWHGLTGADNYIGTPAQAIIYAVTFGIVWCTVVAVSPWQSSRFLMAKNEHVAIRSALFATAALAVTYLFLTFGGFSINLFNDGITPSEIAFIWAGQNVLPSLLGVIAITGIVAAGLSSAASFLSLIGFSAANDVMPYLTGKRVREPELATAAATSTTAAAPAAQQFASTGPSPTSAGTSTPGTDVTTATGGPSNDSTDASGDDDIRGLQVARWTMVVAGLVVLVITWVAPPAVLTIGYFAATLFAASWGPIAFWSVRSTKLSARGAAVGMIAGFVVVAIFESLSEFAGIELPDLLNPTILGFVASIGGTLLGNIGTRPSSLGNAFRERLMVVPEEDRDPVKYRRTRTWVIGTVVILILCGLAMLLLYAVPYAMAVG